MSNPNGSNQYNTDPRQSSFLANYLDPKSETYSNCLQSALKAGYEREYAENLLNLMPKWLSESMDSSGDMRRLRKAEKNLEEVQNLQVLDEEGKVNIPLVEKRSKVDMFLAERLNKNKYSLRTELTGKEGQALTIQFAPEFNAKPTQETSGGNQG
jgi:hypothetical protein